MADGISIPAALPGGAATPSQIFGFLAGLVSTWRIRLPLAEAMRASGATPGIPAIGEAGLGPVQRFLAGEMGPC